MVKLGKNRKFTFIDMTDTFSTSGRPNDAYFKDDVHLTERGLKKLEQKMKVIYETAIPIPEKVNFLIIYNFNYIKIYIL